MAELRKVTPQGALRYHRLIVNSTASHSRALDRCDNTTLDTPVVAYRRYSIAMTTTVNKPGWGWDDAPSTTMTNPAIGDTTKDGFKWEDEPVKAADPPRKTFKTSELPLSSATRTAIEGLSYKFKKKGGYDVIRKQVWKQLEGSVSSQLPRRAMRRAIPSTPCPASYPPEMLSHNIRLY